MWLMVDFSLDSYAVLSDSGVACKQSVHDKRLCPDLHPVTGETAGNCLDIDSFQERRHICITISLMGKLNSYYTCPTPGGGDTAILNKAIDLYLKLCINRHWQHVLFLNSSNFGQLLHVLCACVIEQTIEISCIYVYIIYIYIISDQYRLTVTCEMYIFIALLTCVK